MATARTATASTPRLFLPAISNRAPFSRARYLRAGGSGLRGITSRLTSGFLGVSAFVRALLFLGKARTETGFTEAEAGLFRPQFADRFQDPGLALDGAGLGVGETEKGGFEGFAALLGI
jgi:hypothetical protein